MKSIGETISSLRKKKELTQNELAEKMNVTDKAVSKWERDLSCPDVNTISRLAEVLDVSVEELLNAKEQRKSNNKMKDLVNLIFKGFKCVRKSRYKIFISNAWYRTYFNWNLFIR